MVHFRWCTCCGEKRKSRKDVIDFDKLQGKLEVIFVKNWKMSNVCNIKGYHLGKLLMRQAGEEKGKLIAWTTGLPMVRISIYVD